MKEEILRKAMEKAVKNGYERPVYETFVPIYGCGEYCTIFSHDFAKAFWKPLDGAEEFEQNENGEDWQYHLQQMVLEENPLKYIEKFLTNTTNKE